MTPGQRRALVFLALAVSIVTALLMLPAPQEGSSEGAKPLFPRLEPLDVLALGIRHPGWSSEASFERGDPGWDMLAPAQGRADRARLDALVRELITLEVRDAVEATELGAYGLEPGERIEISLSLEDGDSLELAVGGETVGTGTYLLFEDRVLPALGLIAKSVPAQLDDLRDRAVWQGSVLDTTRLSIAGEATWAVERGPEGWQLTQGQPPTLALEPAETDALLQFLEGLRIGSFEAAEPGLDEALLQVELGDAAGHSLGLDIHRASDGVSYLATISGTSGAVILERASALALLERCGLAAD